MDSLTGELAYRTKDLAPRPADVPLYTTALDDPRSHAPRGPDYWVANLRGRVRFAAAVTAAAEDGHRLFLEVAAHPVVSHSIVETLLHSGIEDHAVIPVLRRDQPESHAVALAIASLWCNGDEIVGGRGAERPVGRRSARYTVGTPTVLARTNTAARRSGPARSREPHAARRTDGRRRREGHLAVGNPTGHGQPSVSG